jgi:hypothetical protein
MEKELRYLARCCKCNRLEGTRFVVSHGKRYYVPAGSVIPLEFRTGVIQTVKLRLVLGQKPICFECVESLKDK